MNILFYQRREYWKYIDRDSLNALKDDPELAKENHPHEQKAGSRRYFYVDSSDSSGTEMLLVF